MLADVARGHGDDGGGNDRPPPYQVTRKPNLGGRRAGGLHTRQETRNLGLKAITDKSGLVPIRFEVDDRETLMPLGDHATHWANYLEELVRELPLHYPSWRQRPPKRKDGVGAKIGFDLCPHIESDRWPQIYAGIQQHLQKIYNGKKAALKERYWVSEEEGSYDLERIRRRRPSHISEADWDDQLAFWNDLKNLARAAQNKQNRVKSKVVCRRGSRSIAALRDMHIETSAIREYPSLIHTFFLTHTVGGVFLNPEDKALYDEMLRIHGLGSNTPTGVPYTEDEILANVRGVKQRGHIPGVGRVLHDRARSDDKFSQMLTQLESQLEYGGGSGSGGCGDDEPGDDEDGGENEEDEDDSSLATYRQGKPSTAALNCLTETMWARRCRPGSLEIWSFEMMVLVSSFLPNPQLETSLLSISLNTCSMIYMIPLGLSGATRVLLSISDLTPPLIGAFWISEINWGFLKLVQDMDDCGIIVNQLMILMRVRIVFLHESGVVVKGIQTVLSVKEIDYQGSLSCTWSDWNGLGETLAHGKWKVTVECSLTETPSIKVYESDFVILCVGRFKDVPNIPTFATGSGPEVFRGKVIHSMEYSAMEHEKAIEFVKGKKVVVVGFQKQGLDIAMECSSVNGTKNPCTIVYRKDRWKLPDFSPWGIPLQYLYLNRLSELIVHKPGEGFLLGMLATILSPL
nr:probable flavin-containing monooxygenase 1 [Tanacetum cinerariifolium]